MSNIIIPQLLFKYISSNNIILVIQMPTSESFYTLLGVSEKASKDDIKKAYRSLSLKHHPDRTSHPESHELFKKISEAYETLGDDQKRQEYDAMQRTIEIEIKHIMNIKIR